MARKIKSILLSCLAIFLIVGTSASLPKLIRPIGTPDIGFPTSQLNADFGVRLLRPSAFYSGGQQIFLFVTQHYTDIGDVVEFGPVQVRAFLYEQRSWVEIKNITVHRSFHRLDMLHSGFPWLTINPPEIHKPAMVRIFFFTNITQVYADNDEIKMNKKSVSYTDIYLQP